MNPWSHGVQICRTSFSTCTQTESVKVINETPTDFSLQNGGVDFYRFIKPTWISYWYLLMTFWLWSVKPEASLISLELEVPQRTGGTSQLPYVQTGFAVSSDDANKSQRRENACIPIGIEVNSKVVTSMSRHAGKSWAWLHGFTQFAPCASWGLGLPG